MSLADKFVRALSVLAALVRGQTLLFPRPNTVLLRVHGRVRVRGPRRNLAIGRRVTFLGDADLVCGWDEPDGKIEIRDGAVFETACYLNAHGGKITVGEHAFVGVRAVIQGKGTVTIGRDSMLGPHVQVYSSDHQARQDGGPYRTQPELAAPVVIGANVWIGANAVILRGTELAPGTVVAAGSVVRLKLAEPALVASAGGLAGVRRQFAAEGQQR